MSLPSAPRGPVEVGDLELPGSLISKAQSGRVTLRGTQHIGFSWTETYLLRTSTLADRAFLALVRRLWRGGEIFETSHPDYAAIKGAGGGSPVVGSAFRQVWQFDDSAGTRVDETTDANDAGASDWAFFPAGAGNLDLVEMGFPVPFGRLEINVGTAGAGTYTVTWEYWNGSAWAALSGLTDGTNAFKTAGTNSVSFTVPADWAALSINGSPALYYVRARRDGGTVTTDPLGTQGFVRDKAFGSSLVVDGAAASITDWLRAGDLFRVTGLPQAFQATADVDTDAAGRATIPIVPPLFEGGIPADGAALDITDPTLRVVILEPPDWPATGATDVGELRVLLAEAL